MVEPRNEMETILLFERMFHKKYEIISFNPTGFPDAVVLDISSGRQYRAEFEFLASSFIEHEHDPRKCDLIICWTNDLDRNIHFPVWGISTQTFGDVFTPSVMELDNFALRIENKMLARKLRREQRNEESVDWRKVRPTLSMDEVTNIAYASTSDIMKIFPGLSDRSARNWRERARDEIKLPQ